MQLHTELDVGLIHRSFRFRQRIVANRNRFAGEARPAGLILDSSDAEFEDVGLGPAMRFREEEEATSGFRGAERAQLDIMIGFGIFEMSLISNDTLELGTEQPVGRYDKDDLVQGSIDALRVPTGPGSLPLPAVIIEWNDDGEQRTLGVGLGLRTGHE
ncbi:hypothetical protein [Bradyrhizobium sp. UFLA05-112]